MGKVMFNIEEARKLLDAANVFFYTKDEEEGELGQTLNMNDVWCWACADGEYVSDEELPQVATLFWRYGNAGILFWVSEKNNCLKSEFFDVNRHIDFVRKEEQIRKDFPNPSDRAYEKISYTIE